VRPAGKLLLKDSLRILRAPAALAQVPLGEILDQRRHVMGIALGKYVDRGGPGAGPVHGAARVDPFLKQIAKPLRPGAGIGERQPREVAKRDDPGPALEFVPESKLADGAAGARFPDPQHQAGDCRVRKGTYAALFDRRAGESADKGSGHWWEKIAFRYTLGTLFGGYALRYRETTRNVISVLNPKKHGIFEQ
jgi:hypothetical protein